MWCDHLFSQRNKATKRAGGGWTKFEKGKDVGNIGRGLEASANYGILQKISFRMYNYQDILFSCIVKFLVSICFGSFRYLNFLSL